ncbi:MAG: energy-coupling factor transporter transmembrane protein EcfT [Firmicutes bacterium]|nr:energy-coupling factor transporter transmembrane protein EcfT [Bacillota bacterium]
MDGGNRMFSGWEVRLRLAAVTLWLIGLLFMDRLPLLLLISLLLLAMIAADQGMQMQSVLRQLRGVSPFILLMLITLSLSGGLPLQKTAVLFALLICLRVIAAVLLVIVLLGGSAADDFLRSLAVLPLPPVYLSLLFLVNRYIHMLTREFSLTRQALRARLYTPSIRPAALKSMGYAVGGMFIRGYDLSEQVYDAMRSRCYAGVIPFDEMTRPQMADWLKLAAAVLLLASALYLGKGV